MRKNLELCDFGQVYEERLCKPHLMWVLLVCLTFATDVRGTPNPTENNPYVGKSWETGDGLPQNSVHALARTADGYLWAGTKGGLSRFDGVRFRNYGLADGLRSVDVSTLMEDGAGGLWIGTLGGGLSHWQAGKITTQTMKDGLANNDVMALARARDGGVWIGSKVGLQHWGRAGFQRIGEAEGIRSEIVALAEDREGGLWVTTEKTGLFYYRDGKWSRVEGPPERPSFHGYCLLVDHENGLWIGIGDGMVLRRKEGRWQTFTESDGLPYSFVYCLAEGAKGEIWAGTQEAGLYVSRAGRFRPVTMPDAAVRSLETTPDGAAWAGTEMGGIVRLVERRLREFPVGTKEHRGRVHGLVEESPGRFWATTYGGGLFQGGWSDLSHFEGMEELEEYPFFLTGLKMRDGTLVFAGPSLLLQRSAGDRDFRVSQLEQPVNALCEDADGTLLLGTRDGQLKRLSEGAITTVEGGLFPASITGLLRPAGRAVWIATQGAGLYEWQEGKTRRWTMAEGLPTDALRTLYMDGDGTLWIGTAGGGLVFFREGKFGSIDSRTGLGDDVVSQILEDERGDLWVGCNRGIYRVSKAEIFAVAKGTAEAVHPLALDQGDGMMGSECTGGYMPAGLRSSSGMLYFSTSRGVAAVNPKKFDAPFTPPSVLIEEVLRDGKPVPTEGSSLVLDPGVRGLEIRFTGLNTIKPQQLRFRYRLGGDSGTWIEVNRKRVAMFAHLAAGNYRFEVSGAGQDGNWSMPPAALSFQVRPFYWESLWFRGLIGLVTVGGAGALVLGLFRFKVKRVVERERLARAEAEVQQHVEELTHLTRVSMLGELSGLLAHELNQPLTAILSNAQAAQRYLSRDNADLGKIRDILDDVVEEDVHAGEVIRNMRVLLKRGEIQRQRLEMNQIVLDALKLIRSDLTFHGVTVHTSLAPDVGSVLGDRVQMQQVLLNLIMNACDAMASNLPHDRQITIRTLQEGNASVRVEVTDQGHGLPDGGEKKAFERFFTTKPQGLGLGLSVCRTILSSHGGTLSGANNADRGATFHFTLPIAKEARV